MQNDVANIHFVLKLFDEFGFLSLKVIVLPIAGGKMLNETKGLVIIL